MKKIKIPLISKSIFLLFSITFFVACASKPHSMQYLVNRSYLQDVGLSRSVNVLDLKGNEKLKTIHIGTPHDVKVENFMTFNSNGDVRVIRKEKGENVILKLVEFKYNKEGLLQWIVPHSYYFESLGYDSIKVEHKGGKPFRNVAYKNEQVLWEEQIIFDEANGDYSFVKQLSPKAKKLYNIYKFENKKLIAEYHRNRTTDTNIDSVKYFYKGDIPYRKSEVFNASLVHVLNYDQLGRAKEGSTMFYNKDSVAWVDKYYYLLQERVPYSIVTSSPMGWREEANYFWEKY